MHIIFKASGAAARFGMPEVCSRFCFISNFDLPIDHECVILEQIRLRLECENSFYFRSRRNAFNVEGKYIRLQPEKPEYTD